MSSNVQVRNKRFRPFTPEEYRQLYQVARGKIPADVFFRGGTVCNVYSGEWIPAHVAVKGRHIAYVGPSEKMIGENTQVIDVSGRFLVPGFIEPHAHPFQLYNPYTLAAFALSHGTTFLINDNLLFLRTMSLEKMEKFFEEAGTWPVKMAWWARLDLQTAVEDPSVFFSSDRMNRLLRHPAVLQAGELTAWPQLLAGDEALAENLLAAVHGGERVEGHLPGASVETLASMTAAGVTACHEAINGDEVLRRLRLGLWAILRYSSLRPDLPVILRDLLDLGVKDWQRMLLTTDGSTPPFLEKGLTDEMIQVAIAAGLEPMRAYQMATIQPAMYYGLDAEVGGIAPGRLADLLILSDPMQPTPQQVWAEGTLAAEEGKLLIRWKEPDWDFYEHHPVNLSWRARREDFCLREEEKRIHIFLENPAITRLGQQGEDDGLTAVLLSRDGRSIVRAALSGFARNLDGLASSFTAAGDLLVIGREPSAMQRALNRVLDLGGGIVLWEGNEVRFELPLPLMGMMSRLPMDDLIQKGKRFVQLMKERGNSFEEVFYSLLFLTSTHLPEVRLTSQGILHVKSGEWLAPSQRREAE